MENKLITQTSAISVFCCIIFINAVGMQYNGNDSCGIGTMSRRCYEELKNTCDPTLWKILKNEDLDGLRKYVNEHHHPFDISRLTVLLFNGGFYGDIPFSMVDYVYRTCVELEAPLRFYFDGTSPLQEAIESKNLLMVRYFVETLGEDLSQLKSSDEDDLVTLVMSNSYGRTLKQKCAMMQYIFANGVIPEWPLCWYALEVSEGEEVLLDIIKSAIPEEEVERLPIMAR
ncbi:MAG: hypothetical protein LBC04_03295 [Holosporaceae bacterium]|jgi:hypothetical protein|nr:hypothetical protein [Holosporaceae bacterium]